MIELQQTLNVRGYPTGWFVKAEKVNGKINLTQIDKLGYVNGGANAWINLASQIINKYIMRIIVILFLSVLPLLSFSQRATQTQISWVSLKKAKVLAKEKK
jgi:hypothetical protein